MEIGPSREHDDGRPRAFAWLLTTLRALGVVVLVVTLLGLLPIGWTLSVPYHRVTADGTIVIGRRRTQTWTGWGCQTKADWLQSRHSVDARCRPILWERLEAAWHREFEQMPEPPARDSNDEPIEAR